MRHDYSTGRPHTPTLTLDSRNTGDLRTLVDEECDNQQYPPGGVALTLLEWLRPVVEAGAGVTLAPTPVLSPDVMRTLHIVLDEYARAVRAAGAGRVALDEWVERLPGTHADRSALLVDITAAEDSLRAIGA